jgi:hypothetical protein
MMNSKTPSYILLPCFLLEKIIKVYSLYLAIIDRQATLHIVQALIISINSHKSGRNENYAPILQMNYLKGREKRYLDGHLVSGRAVS